MKIKIHQPLSIHELGKRANQEDNIWPDADKATEENRLFILCDGMGGHEHGEVASMSVCQSMSSFLQPYLKKAASIDDEVLLNALTYAYGELDKLAIKGDTRQMGTTLVMLCFHNKGCTAMHIGDSRIYHLRPSTHTLLYKSRDHSLAYDLYQAGELSYEEIKTFPQKNVITRAMIAGDRNHPKADIVHITDIQPGDYFYICSDGMLEQMDDEELLQIFSIDKSDEEKRNMLTAVTKANRDNHSAYIVHIKEVVHEETDVTLVNEEPAAKCNAINIKPDVIEVKHTADVEIVDNTTKQTLPIGTPPPLHKHKWETMWLKLKTRRTWIFAIIALLAIVFTGGILGYGYLSKNKARKEIVKNSHKTASMSRHKKAKRVSLVNVKSKRKQTASNTANENKAANSTKEDSITSRQKKNKNE